MGTPVAMLAFFGLLLLAHGSAAAKGGFASKPHIIMNLIDDFGWAETNYHREESGIASRETVTPTMDMLVRTGIELDRHYTYKFCSPTRSSLMSGRLPIHVNILNDDPTFYNPNDPVSGFAAIPRNMTRMASKLKLAGYHTHHVGKWDAGMATLDHTPHGSGFDTSFGYFHHANDYWTMTTGDAVTGKNCTDFVDLFATQQPAYGLNGTAYEEALFAEHVLSIIEDHDPSEPLFMYYAPHIVHAPLEVPKEYLHKFSFINNTDRHRYHAMVNYLDDVLGRVVESLKRKGMWENTLWVSSSDNGGPSYVNGGANNYPLKGGKMTNWEGGVRVNAWVSGGLVPDDRRGTKYEGMIAVCDWYATFCYLAGQDPFDARAAAANLPPVDSLNLWPIISGENLTSPRTEVPLDGDTKESGIIVGQYKLLVGPNPQAGWTGPHFPNETAPTGGINATEYCGTKGCLYNIFEDPTEHVNLVDDPGHADILQMMHARLNATLKTWFNPNRGSPSDMACQAAVAYGGFWGPFVFP